MIVDPSAVIAILWQEPEAETFARAIDQAASVRMSAASATELFIVIDRASDPAARGHADETLARMDLIIEPFTAEHSRLARQAYRDFGRGSGHRAGLNMGDCISYALAKATGEPLLYKGDDFVHTDIRSAVED